MPILLGRGAEREIWIRPLKLALSASCTRLLHGMRCHGILGLEHKLCHDAGCTGLNEEEIPVGKSIDIMSEDLTMPFTVPNRYMRPTEHLTRPMFNAIDSHN